MKCYITMPEGTTTEQLTQIKNKISRWYIVERVVVEGLSIKWEQAKGYGSGAESLHAFVEGLMSGFSIGQPKKLISYGVERNAQ